MNMQSTPAYQQLLLVGKAVHAGGLVVIKSWEGTEYVFNSHRMANSIGMMQPQVVVCGDDQKQEDDLVLDCRAGGVSFVSEVDNLGNRFA